MAPPLSKPPLALFRRLSLSLYSRQISFQPSISNPRAQIERYPFVADFADTPLQLLVIQPQSKAHLQISFSLFKSVLWFGYVEIRFQLFTDLPFNLF